MKEVLRGILWELNQSFWQDRPTFVTGGNRIGGELANTPDWLEAKADVVCLVRDWVPQSEFFRNGLIEKVTVVRGDLRDHALLERVLGEYEITTVMHLAAQTIVAIANRNPISTFETNIGGNLEVAGSVPANPADRADCGGLSRIKPMAIRRCCHTVKTPLCGKAPLRCQQVVRRFDRNTLTRSLQVAGCHYPLRQLLRGGRSQLESNHFRHDPLGGSRTAPRHSIGWLICPRLFLCRRWGGGLYVFGGTIGRAARTQRTGFLTSKKTRFR